MAVRKAASLLGAGVADDLPESFWYSVKRRLLGPPMVNEQLRSERLSKPLALGVLSSDGISSANYGSELILHELLPFFGLTAFTILLPMTGVILLGIALVVLSYREVVSVYTRAGGSYVVARENFGPRVAQVAAVALMVDYVVTVAVQTAAGSAAILSAFPALAKPLGPTTTLLIIAVTATLVMCYVNLRGIRENGKTFALPTYLFSGSVGLMILVGLSREAFGGGLPHATWGTGIVAPHHHVSGLLTFGAIYVLGRAFANGGSSLTGIEAVSNAVSALRAPEGRNARQLLVIQGCIVAFLIAGISWLAHITHAIPYANGFPTVLSQEAKLIFGHTIFGQILFYVVQAGAISILFTGGNTSFSGFPFLTSFVAEDSFLPRWLSKRGHRLVFSDGIIVLTVLALALLLVVGANLNALVPFYAIGVFTGFSMAGFGMARYHRRVKEQAWRRRLVINAVGGVYTALVVVIFAIVKFTEGAWLVLVVFPILVLAFIRLNREYTMESEVLERIGDRPRLPAAARNYTHRTVFVFVDSFDLATLAAIRYARSLRPTRQRAIHFMIDSTQADQLRQDWTRAGLDVVLDFIDVPDRRIAHAAAELVSAEAAQPGTQVTVVLPRRSYSPLLGRLLHDRTADKIAAVVSQIPNSAATIVPFDVRSRLEVLHARQVAQAQHDGKAASVPTPPGGGTLDVDRAKDAAPPDQAGDPATVAAGAAGKVPPVVAAPPASALRTLLRGRRRGRDDQEPAKPAQAKDHASYDRPVPPPGVTPIGAIVKPGKHTVEGRVRAIEIRPVERNSVLACEISDSTGDLTALFYGRSHIAGVICGSRVRFRGQVGLREEGPIMINPAYELLGQGTGTSSGGEGSPGGGASRHRRRGGDEST
ncbi:MAG TPA: amino acid permease [Streptosporangiaceae bacterium]|nr:amino acid permease [Streptosporangiaceae bacterium]